MSSESDAWAIQQPVAEPAVDFAIAFLGCRMGPASDQPLEASAVLQLKKITRAVSWVESQHGTGAGNQAARDPLQCGNPGDSWWQELTGQSGNGDRFIRGPGLSNIWANQVAAAAQGDGAFNAAASVTLLGNQDVGHNDANFAPAHSYVWGVLFLIFKINTTAGDSCYQCGDVNTDRLVAGAVQYNGGGDPNYEAKIRAALALIGGVRADARRTLRSSSRPRKATSRRAAP